MKLYNTVTRHKFTTDNGVDIERVGRDLAQMVTWMAEAEREVIASQEFHGLALQVLQGDRPTGSLNSWGRRRLPRYDFSFQKHNMNEILVSKRGEYSGTVRHECWSVPGDEYSFEHNKTRPYSILLQGHLP